MAENLDSKNQYWNYVLFCLLYSTAHGAVDAVLAYSTAELGSTIGSNGSFALYILYTTSALLLAKSALRRLGPKNSIFCGLCGMLIYVASFFMAIQIPSYANMIFTTGGVFGGIGAGLLWPAQGAYFSLSALKYATSSKSDEKVSVALYAAIFATIYLGLETLFKIFATIIYLLNGRDPTWHLYVFGAYTVAAYCSVISFGIFVQKISPIKDIENHNFLRIKLSNMSTDTNNVNKKHNHNFEILSRNNIDVIENEHGQTAIDFDVDNDFYSERTLNPMNKETVQNNKNNNSNGNIKYRNNIIIKNTNKKSEFFILKHDILCVMKAIKNNHLLQLMLPYQICFGLSAGFVGYYINNDVVATYIGDGYIGVLSALSTFFASLLSYPFAIISKSLYGKGGKYYIMIFGSLCFCSTGLGPLCLSDSQLSKWNVIIFYYILHGIARGCWENTNKAVIVEYFKINEDDNNNNSNNNNNDNSTNDSNDSNISNSNANNNNRKIDDNDQKDDNNNPNKNINNNNNSNDNDNDNENILIDNCDTAFSAIYFTSGLSSSVGYYFYKYMTRNQMVLINFIVPLIALISYHYSNQQFLSIILKSKLTTNSKTELDLLRINDRKEIGMKTCE